MRLKYSVHVYPASAPCKVCVTFHSIITRGIAVLFTSLETEWHSVSPASRLLLVTGALFHLFPNEVVLAAEFLFWRVIPGHNTSRRADWMDYIGAPVFLLLSLHMFAASAIPIHCVHTQQSF
jgi:hypothetical protein